MPQYRVWHDGVLTEQRHDIVDLWQDDWVAFALGCSFSFEEALIAAGIEIRNISEGVNVPMYRTHIDCKSAGPFGGKMVVSMRPMPAQMRSKRSKSAPGIHPSTAHRFIWVIRKPSALLIWRSPTSVTPSRYGR